MENSVTQLPEFYQIQVVWSNHKYRRKLHPQILDKKLRKSVEKIIPDYLHYTINLIK